MNRFKNILVGSAVSVLMFTLAVPPASAQSATMTDLQAQIAALMAQIAALNSGGTTTPVFVASDKIITTSAVRVRAIGSIFGQQLGRQAAGSVGIVTSGPITAGGHTWYRINFDTGVDGWVASANFGHADLPDEEETSLTVTAPNGGEKWEIGVTNTVTWRPYGYNPDVNPARDVTAYLETKNADGSFKTLGKVQESGKASIHWPTGELNSGTFGGNYAPAGSGYYIRVVNNKTNEIDRSDKPFTLLAKPIDLKINGSDGPVKVGLNEKVVATWSTKGFKNCEIQNAYKDTSRKAEVGEVSLNGKMELYLSADLAWGPTIYCYRIDGTSQYDSVKRTAPVAGTAAFLKVVSPNGGEKIDSAKSMRVNFEADGISTLSVGLYKNDKWKAWIIKDLNLQTADLAPIEIVPNTVVAGLGEGDNTGNIFKIYVTGQKADGSGYVEDKSDSAFQFTASSATESSFTLADVSKVTKKIVDNNSALDDEYTVYTITLKNKMVKTLKIPVRSSPDMRIRLAKEVGFSGSGSDLEKLLALATESPQVRYDLPKTKTAFVQYLYRCALDRAPDEAGQKNWVNATRTVPVMYTGFLNSAEFTKKNLNNPQFVDKLYQCVLFREADQAGKNGWVARLVAGDSRVGVLNRFMASTEYNSKIKLTLDKLIQTTSTPPTIPPVAPLPPTPPTPPVTTLPTPRFNSLSGERTLTVEASAVFGRPASGPVGVTGPVRVGTVNWGNGVTAPVFTLVTGNQMTVPLRHTYRTSGSYIITLTDLANKSVSRQVVISASSTGQVRGASTDAYAQMAETLQAISIMLRTLEVK